MSTHRRVVAGFILFGVIALLGAARTPSAGGSLSGPGAIRFAVIGDYGNGSSAEGDVANLVKGWNPDFIVTLGDNNYPDGASQTIDDHIGQFYHDFIYPYSGNYGVGAVTNRFFPVLGNHDWHTRNARPYLNYFTLPGNERYYDFVQGPAHFFMLDSDPNEPDGNTSASVQAGWLQNSLAASTAPWKLVLLHHAPYSSGAVHGSNATLQWPYTAWDATAVLAGHDHIYERIAQNGIPYFVNGLGGSSIYAFATPIAGSQVRYNADYGAMLVVVETSQITFQFISRAGGVIDTYTLPEVIATDTPTPTPPPTDTSTPAASETPAPGSTSTSTATPTGTPTSAPAASASPTSTHTPTGTQLPGSTSTSTAAPTPTPTRTPTKTQAPDSTPTSTASPTGASTGTATPTRTPTSTPTPPRAVTPAATPAQTSDPPRGNFKVYLPLVACNYFFAAH